MPSLILRYRVWDIIGSIAYTLMFALFEALVFWFVFSILAVLIPVPKGKDRFTIRATGTFLLVFFGLMTITLQSVKEVVQVVGGATATVMLLFLISRRDRWIKALVGLLDRLGVLAGFYLALDIVSLSIVVFRNVF